MQLGYLFILSGILILSGCLGIMFMFTSEEDAPTPQSILFAMGISISICLFNFITCPPYIENARIFACLLGGVAVCGFICNKKKHVNIARLMISLSIILGLIQLILTH